MTPASDTLKIDRIAEHGPLALAAARSRVEAHVDRAEFLRHLVENGVNRWKQRRWRASQPHPQLSPPSADPEPLVEVPRASSMKPRARKASCRCWSRWKVQRWRQPPDRRTPWARSAFVMPNSKAIYLHDTNARSRFTSDVRRSATAVSAPSTSSICVTQLLSDDEGP
jgi:hypothetical protein